jgi:hypothetical protein
VAEFLALLIALSVANPPVHRCVGSDSVVRYQDVPCADGEAASEVRLRREPETVAAPPPEEVLVEGGDEGEDSQPRIPVVPPPGPTSWRCEVENGEVYFRHDACPPQISEPVALVNALGETFATVLSHRVSGVPVPRTEACREIERGGRFGAERDQRAEPYDKLSGRDPCR